MQFLEDFEKGAGTYLKVIRFSQPTNPDGFVVLYLRPNGRFLMAGYWTGYERSVVAGTWLRQGVEVRLEGNGRLSTDEIPGPEGGQFQRVFVVEHVNHTPSLAAPAELSGWSLLGWKGPFMYVGQRTTIDPDGRWLPDSLSIVDKWIQDLLPA